MKEPLEVIRQTGSTMSMSKGRCRRGVVRLVTKYDGEDTRTVVDEGQPEFPAQVYGGQTRIYGCASGLIVGAERRGPWFERPDRATRLFAGATSYSRYNQRAMVVHAHCYKREVLALLATGAVRCGSHLTSSFARSGWT
jgi:hypothetical protein